MAEWPLAGLFTFVSLCDTLETCTIGVISCVLSPCVVVFSADKNKLKQLFILLGNYYFHHNYCHSICIARRVSLLSLAVS